MTPRRVDGVFILILLAACVGRLYLAGTVPYIHDEENTAIPLSSSISFAPGHMNLPLRAENHPALPAYFVKLSSTLFGTSRLGYRAAHLLAGLATIALVYLLTSQWYGPVAARWAAALLAFNEYYLGVSARATAHVPMHLLVAVAIYAFSRFLRSQRPAYLYAVSAALGFAFYTKEHTALLVPVFLLALLRRGHWHWLRSPHVYLAAGLFAIMLAPDVYWNLTTNRETARVPYAQGEVGYATYRSHLERIGGFGFSPYPSMFYAHDPVQSVYRFVTGNELKDETPEYRPINPALGMLLVGAVVITILGQGRHDDLGRLLALVFCGLFAFFTAIHPGDPPGRLDPVSWIWVELTMIPAVVLAGARLSEMVGWSRLMLWASSGAALVYAVATTFG